MAEFIALLGFGAVLPILPLYIVEQGVDAATLGIIVAAWPAARLVAEPVFGWLADRTPRAPLMVAGITVIAVAVVLPLVWRGAAELLLLRLLGGLGAGMYDPAARGYLVDATRPGERGQVFGLYQAASMGGIVTGPGLAALGTQVWPGYAFPFLAAGAACFAAALYLAVALPRATRSGAPTGLARGVIAEASFAEYGTDSSAVARRAAEDRERATDEVAPLRAVLNRWFAAAVLMNFGVYVAVGVYEVVWSLYMRDLGASVSWIGVTFVLFGAPILVLSPAAGRLVDRLGARPFALFGGASLAIMGVLYTFAREPVFPAVLGVAEGSAHAFLGPAIYAILALGSPPGRTSTTQGLFGAAGTLAFIVGSLVAGRLLAVDVRVAFYFFAVATAASFALAWLILRSGRGARLTGALSSG